MNDIKENLLCFDKESPRLRGAMIHYVQEVLEEFRSAIGQKDIPLQAFYAFLVIPRNGEADVGAVMKAMRGLGNASVSRNLQLLSGVSKLRQGGGWKFLEYREDPEDRRHKLYKLSSEGIKLRDRMYTRGMKFIEQAAEVEAKHLQKE